MEAFFESYLPVSGVILTLFGVYLTYRAYKKSRKKSVPSYWISNTNIFEDKPQLRGRIKVFFDNLELENCSVAKILIWNRGDQSIRYSDIPALDLLRIEAVDDIKILEAEQIFSSNQHCNFSAELADNQVTIGFDYIDQGDGVVLQLFHTGKSGKALSLCGSVIEYGGFIDARLQAEHKRVWMFAFSFLFLFLALGLSIYEESTGAISDLSLLLNLSIEKPDRIIAAPLILVSYSLMLFAIYYYRYGAIPKPFRKMFFESSALEILKNANPFSKIFRSARNSD